VSKADAATVDQLDRFGQFVSNAEPCGFPYRQAAAQGGNQFSVELRPECRCLSGELTIRYNALQGGPAGSPSSANDTVGIYSGGSIVPGTSQALYSGAVTTGQTGTKTIRLSCDWLKNNRLSFLVQDDTSVTSATLHVVYCCSPCPPGQAEVTFPGTNLKYCCEGKPGAPRFCCTAQERPANGELPQ
jgi:hypothetical protein